MLMIAFGRYDSDSTRSTTRKLPSSRSQLNGNDNMNHHAECQSEYHLHAPFHLQCQNNVFYWLDGATD